MRFVSILLKVVICMIAALVILSCLPSLARMEPLAFLFNVFWIVVASFLFTWTIKSRKPALWASLALTVTILPILAMQWVDFAKPPPDLSEFGIEIEDPVIPMPEDPYLAEITKSLTPEGRAEFRMQQKRSVEIAMLMLLIQTAAVAFLFNRRFLK